VLLQASNVPIKRYIYGSSVWFCGGIPTIYKAMNILLLPDKFKGSLSAAEVMDALTRGILLSHPEANCIPVLASDGGDGFLDAVSKYLPVERIRTQTTDPLGREIEADYLLSAERGEAYFELAQASGLVLLEEPERSPMTTSTLGTGILINNAIQRGARKVFIGLGGSATNDAGIGIASALGYRFLDSRSRELPPVGSSLTDIETIHSGPLAKAVRETSFVAINDVNNPLYGQEGAAYVYAAQKGADKEEIKMLDSGLRRIDRKVAEQLGKNLGGLPGTGAAGGTSFGLKAFFDANFLSGIDFILGIADIPNMLKDNPPDFIITGEGKIDRQTLSGKLISGVVKLGKAENVPVLAVCGMLDVDRAVLREEGLYDILEIRDPNQSLQYNMRNASDLLEQATWQYFQKLKENGLFDG
jgi:glycerate kinase